MKFKVLFTTCIASAFLLACQEPDKTQNEIKIQGQTMGTYYQVTVVGDFKGGEQSLRKLAENTFNMVIDEISTYDENSAISRFNKTKKDQPFYISKYLSDNIELINRESARIGFATDISVGPAVNLWGFGPDKSLKNPTDAQLQEAKAYVGHDKYELRYDKNAKGYLIKHNDNVYLDLSTVGEGMGADALAQKLDELGVHNYLISVAGANRSSGVNAKGKPWRIGIENGNGNGVSQAVCPLSMGMSTAGSYRNYYTDKDGNRLSHIIDPKTLKPITHHTVSVTVIARNATITDTLDTGLLVLGADKAIDFANRNDLAIYTIEVGKDGKFITKHSVAFEKYLNCNAK